jgi:hypothetical protein
VTGSGLVFIARVNSETGIPVSEGRSSSKGRKPSNQGFLAKIKIYQRKQRESNETGIDGSYSSNDLHNTQHGTGGYKSV